MAKANRICSVDGCGKAHLSRGYCAQHYGRMRKFGDPIHPDTRLRPSPLGTCSVDECGKKAVTSRGWCQSHDYRWKTHGDPLKGGTGQGQAKRWVEDNALKCTDDNCLVWPFSSVKSGYGKLWDGSRLVLAHRFVCEAVHGKPEDEAFEAAHSCGNNACVNHRHLRWASHGENESDKIVHGTRLRGEAIGNSKLTADIVIKIRKMEGKVSVNDVAKTFGISKSYVRAIQSRKSWGWLA